MTRLPPGQIETGRFPVVGERTPSSDLASRPSSWEVTVGGEVAAPLRIDLATFLARADRTIRFDIHCVTSWTRFDTEFTGLPLAELVEEAGPSRAARFVSFVAYSDRGHHTSLPLDVAAGSSWLVHSVDGRPLPLEHGGPVRVVTPGRYFYKSLKWVRRVEVLAEDRLGWWEENSSYHNNADPESGAERFTTGSLRPDHLRRFVEAGSYDKYRGRVFIGLDLRGWRPSTRALSRLYLKNCDLRGVDLSGADLANANLSLSDLRGAGLAGADLSGADLEGANFAGADLRGADLSGSALSATRFRDGETGALVDGMTMPGAWGLLEDQEGYLVEQGVI